MGTRKNFYLLHVEICKTIANPKRLEILDNLRDTALTVRELAERTGMPQANLSQHLAIMRASGILNTRREGVNIYYTIANPKIIEAFDIISEILKETLASQNKTVSEALSENRV